MKILYICTYYHRALIFRDSMNELIKKGHEVKAFNAVVYNTEIDNKYLEIMDELVIHKECFNKWDRFLYFVKQKKIYNALVSVCDIKQFGLVHSHMLFTGGYVAFLLKKKFGIPYVISVRNTDINVFLKFPFFVKLANQIVNEASGVHFLSPAYQKQFINSYVHTNSKIEIKKKSIVINNGLEEFWLENKKQAKNYNKNTINLICVGKIDKNKNIITTILAAKILIKQGYSIKLTVVGQILDQKLLNEIKKENFVEIIHYLKKEELLEIYSQNDIYVMPSITESFGRVYAEAMTQGLPVIYSKGQGFDGIFEDGHIGYSVPSKDANYIAKSILTVLENYSEMSKRCIEASTKFSWENIGNELENFYIDSLERR